MPDGLSFIELVTGFATILLSVCFLILTNYALNWLPSRALLVMLLVVGIVIKSSIFAAELFSSVLSRSVFLLTFPLILLLGPVLTGFTHSTLLMEKQRLWERSTQVLLIVGYLLIKPYFFVQFLPPSDWLSILAIGGVMMFISLFVLSSSWHFVPVLWRLSRGGLYSVGYGDNTYYWLRGVWLSMSLIWLMLLFDTVSVYYFDFDPPNGQDAVFAVADLIIWIALLYFTVVYCRKPHQKQDIERCEVQQRYEKSALTDTHADKILSDVDELMKTQQLFLDSNITQDTVAARIKTQPQYLSQAINQYRQVNFYEFIAQYRIEFAKRELMETPLTRTSWTSR